MPLIDNQYLVQVSYIGTNENTAYLRASFEFIAHTKRVAHLPFLRLFYEIQKTGKLKK